MPVIIMFPFTQGKGLEGDFPAYELFEDGFDRKNRSPFFVAQEKKAVALPLHGGSLPEKTSDNGSSEPPTDRDPID